MTDRFLTISQAAERLGVHVNTLRAWADKGRVPHIRTPTRQRRFRAEDIDKLVMPVAMSAPPDPKVRTEE